MHLRKSFYSHILFYSPVSSSTWFLNHIRSAFTETVTSSSDEGKCMTVSTSSLWVRESLMKFKLLIEKVKKEPEQKQLKTRFRIQQFYKVVQRYRATGLTVSYCNTLQYKWHIDSTDLDLALNTLPQLSLSKTACKLSLSWKDRLCVFSKPAKKIWDFF